jgi:hypothetical protein
MSKFHSTRDKICDSRAVKILDNDGLSVMIFLVVTVVLVFMQRGGVL